MKVDIKLVIVTVLVVFLLMEVKSFFEQGGRGNSLAYSLFKMIVFASLGFFSFNYRLIIMGLLNTIETANSDLAETTVGSITKMILRPLVNK